MDYNKILKDNDTLICNYVKNQVRSLDLNLPFSFPVEDIIQEVRIKLWEKLKENYNPERAKPSTFIYSYLPNTLLGVIHHIESSLKYTGTADKNKTRARRTESGKLRKNLVYLSDHRGLLFDGFIDDPDKIDEKLDWETIINEMEKELEEFPFLIFKHTLEGYNQSDISYRLTLSPSKISQLMNEEVKPTLKKIIIRLNSI